ncbi:SDR family oxidoreductase [Jatrophihabitans fulvus]
MKVVVIGGTGLIGRQVVDLLVAAGHEAVAAAPSTGVDILTGEGLAESLAGADVVVDVTNSPSFADDDVLAFFQTAGRTIAEAESAAGVRHHVALSIVGADRVPDSGYMRAKVAQEAIVEQSGVPYTIVRATQFFEFLRAIADSATVAGVVRIPDADIQPMAASDVARAVADAAVAAPVGGRVEVAGPERIPFASALSAVLDADGDTRTVVGEPHARYFGTELDDDSITAGPDATLARVTFADWLATRPAAAPH